MAGDITEPGLLGMGDGFFERLEPREFAIRPGVLPQSDPVFQARRLAALDVETQDVGGEGVEAGGDHVAE